MKFQWYSPRLSLRTSVKKIDSNPVDPEFTKNATCDKIKSYVKIC